MAPREKSERFSVPPPKLGVFILRHVHFRVREREKSPAEGTLRLGSTGECKSECPARGPAAGTELMYPAGYRA